MGILPSGDPTGWTINNIFSMAGGGLLNNIIGIMTITAGTVAAIFIVIGGFYFVAAQGDPAKIETGKKIILYTLIGLLIIFLSYGLISLIKQVIGVK